ncbi:MAG: LysR family transcriptional regulator [Acidobacteriota bacterium]
MDLDVLRTFADVMRRGSFATVARDRNVDPSSISRAIASLERELGIRLFHRTTRRLSPTEAGALYFDRIEPVLEELEHAGLQASEIDRAPRGTLRIACPVSFALLNLVPLLPELDDLYPELAIDLLLTDATLDLVEERIDVAIRLGPLADSGLVARRLATMVARVCASPSYLERHGRPTTPTDLVHHNCLLLDMPGFDAQWRFRDRETGATTAVSVRGNLHTSNAIALKECALAGRGVILQARWIVGRELRHGTLVDLFPDHDVTAAAFDDPAVWLLYPSRSYLPRKVEVFLDFVTKRFSAHAPWDTP